METAAKHNSGRRVALPMGLSLLVNACLIGAFTKLLLVPSIPAETRIAVELERVRPPVVHSRPVRVIKTPQPSRAAIVTSLPSTPQPMPRSTAARPLPQPSPVTRVLPSRPQEMHPQVPATVNLSSGPAVVGGTENAGAGTAGSGTGGTTSTGPGAASGHGNGGGPTTGHGGAPVASTPRPEPPSVSHGTGQEHAPTTPRPEPPKPAPKGESRKAQALSRPDPAYPSDARDDGVEGTVVLIAYLDASGRVTRTTVQQGSGDRRLDRAAEKAVRTWTYSPALKDGTPVETQVRVRVQFRLRD